MIIDLNSYRTIVFDCDGVILDSNKVKTEAFFKVALPYGERAARRLVEYHTQNGGISRFKKFEYFLSTLVTVGAAGPGVDELLATYAAEVREGLLNSSIAEGLAALREQTPNVKWLIASGGAEAELRDIFRARGLTAFFDGGIFGSPDTKEFILEREIAIGNIQRPALFLGDSRYDHVAASAHGLDFVFVQGWSEFVAWESYCSDRELPVVHSLFSLLS